MSYPRIFTNKNVLFFLFAACLTVPPSSVGQTSFSFTPTNISFDDPNSSFLSFLVVADVNGDGKPDIITTGALDSTLFVQISRGDGTFDRPQAVSVGTGNLLFPVIVADVNGDGFPDIIAGTIAQGTTTLLTGQIEILPGNGDGTFKAPVPFASVAIGGLGALPLALTVGDFNHDGNLDIAVEESTGINNLANADLTDLLQTLLGTSYLVVFNGDGHGNFTSSTPVSIMGGGGLVLLTADFNEDGYSDLVYNQVAAGTITVQLGQADGGFGPAVTYPSFTAFPENGLQMRIADMNGDGKPDLIMTTGQNNAVLIYNGNGDGTFQAPSQFAYHDTGGLAIADFNADGYPDVAIGTVASFNATLLSGVVPSIGTDPIAIMPGSIAGPVASATTVVGGGAVPLIMEAADFNGDGLPDLAVMNILSATVTVLINQGVRPTLGVVSTASGIPAVAPESLAALYGTGLAALPESATLPLPTTLRGVSVQVTDSAGVARLAPMLYLGTSQINFQIPSGTAVGQAKLVVQGAFSGSPAGEIQIKAVAPGLYTANANGSGVAAAIGTRLSSQDVQSAVPIFSCPASGGCVPVPIALDSASTLYISLYGTGIRGTGAAITPTCKAAGISIPVLYAGSQQQFTGLDQVNLQIPQSLAGKGLVSLYLTVNGQTANPVTLNFQ